jgi:transposase
MLSNAIRAHMAELGIISAKGRNGTAELLKIIVDEQDDRITAAARFSLDVLARQYAAVRTGIVAIEKRIHVWHRSSEESRRLEEIPGVGPIVATALVAEVGDWKEFTSGRSLAAWIGLVLGSIRPEAKKDSAESRSRAIDTCAGCSSLVPWLSSDMRASAARSGFGSLA